MVLWGVGGWGERGRQTQSFRRQGVGGGRDGGRERHREGGGAEGYRQTGRDRVLRTEGVCYGGGGVEGAERRGADQKETEPLKRGVQKGKRNGDVQGECGWGWGGGGGGGGGRSAETDD